MSQNNHFLVDLGSQEGKSLARFRIFNHTSEHMEEIPDGVVDLVITDPPWNMGVQFGGFLDKRPEEHYQEFLTKVIQELKRVLKDSGVCVVISSNRVNHEGRTADLSDLYQNLWQKAGFSLIGSLELDFVESEETAWAAVPLAEWETKGQGSWAYSKEGRIQVFSKNRAQKISPLPNKVSYFYEPQEGHPCPFGQEQAKDLVKMFLGQNQVVLDPFMGVANLGVEIVKNGRIFYGYELDKKFFETAEDKLKKAEKK